MDNYGDGVEILKEKYNSFTDVLSDNYSIMETISNINDLTMDASSTGTKTIKEHSNRAYNSINHMIDSLKGITGEERFLERGYDQLYIVADQINNEINHTLNQHYDYSETPYVLPFDQITKDMGVIVGGKCANLGEMITKTGVPVPPGFAITAKAYRDFIEYNGLQEKIDSELSDIDYDDTQKVTNTSKRIRKLISQGKFSSEMKESIESSFKQYLEDAFGEDVKVAVRSSATAEDLPGASFAGQHDTYLNVGRNELLEKVRDCFSSMYTPRAIVYRQTKGFDHSEVAVSDAIQLMVDSEVSGIMFSRDPTHSDRDAVAIDAIYGLGEYIVSGKVSSDHFVVDKKTGEYVEKEIATQKIMLTTDGADKEIEVPEELQNKPKLTDSEIKKLVSYAKALEKHYGSPQDIEWAKDKASGKLFIVQSRPITSLNNSKDHSDLDLSNYNTVQENGITASVGIGYGQAYVINKKEDIYHFPTGAILVAKTTSPDYVPAMKKASAIVTESGSYVCHAAIVAREFGIPAIVAAENSLKHIHNGDKLTVDADTHTVYNGKVSELLELEKEESDYIANEKQSWYKMAKDYVAQLFSSESSSSSKNQTKLATVKSLMSPLNLTDSKSTKFRPENCETYHDIVRYIHEKSVDEMFNMKDNTSFYSARSLYVNSGTFRVIDLGGAFSNDDSSSFQLDDVTSTPLTELISMYNSSEEKKGSSSETYNILATKDYINASITMGCHHATLDAMITDDSSNNFVNFQYIESGFPGSHKREQLVKYLIKDEGFAIEEDPKTKFFELYQGKLKATLKGASKEDSLKALNKVARVASSVTDLDISPQFFIKPKLLYFPKYKKALNNGCLDLVNISGSLETIAESIENLFEKYEKWRYG